MPFYSSLSSAQSQHPVALHELYVIAICEQSVRLAAASESILEALDLPGRLALEQRQDS